MKISIITICYNSENTIAETLDSVLNQTYQGEIEYIIKDGLSTDRTLEIARSYSEKFKSRNISYKIVSEKDNGIFDAMNIGIQMADGDLIGMINSDDYYTIDALEKAADFYKKENYDIMYGDLRIFSKKKDFIKRSRFMPKKFTTRHWNHPTMFVRSSVYRKILYRTDIAPSDLHFILQARNEGYKIRVLNEVLANFRLGGVSNKKSWAQCKASITERNRTFKENGCTNYKFENWLVEVAKFFLVK